MLKLLLLIPVTLVLSGCLGSGMQSAQEDLPGVTGDPTFNSCVLPASLGGGVLAHNSSITAFQASSVPNGQTCVSENRICNDGVLGGSYLNATCSVQGSTTNPCTLDGVTVAHGQSRTFFNSTTVTCGQTCDGLSRTCNNGTFSGNNSYNRAACAVGSCTASCPLPWGGTIAHNASVTAYLASSVPNGQTCTNQTRTCNNGTLSGSYSNQNCSVQAPPTGTGDLFSNVTSPGTVDVTLHPSSPVVGVSNTPIIFGVPFPKGLVTNTNMIRVLDGSNQEIPSQVEVLNSWRNFNTPSQIVSIRSAKITIQRTFANTSTQLVRVQFGVARQSNLAGTFSVSSTWQPVSLGVNPNEYRTSDNVSEPKVYATLPAAWLSMGLLQTRTTSLNEVSTYTWFDNAFLDFSSDAVQSSVAYLTNRDAWLYDRAQTLYITYMRSGDIQWLRHAHRAAQFYKNNISTSGSFALGGDAKYTYGKSMVYDYMLTADPSLLTSINYTLVPHAGHTTNFTASTGFWTERNAAYALHAVLAAFEVTGDVTHANRARALFNSFFAMQQTPINGWTANGCSMHTKNQHDPSEDIPDVMCSPWMGALLSEAVWKYYILSQDNNALIYLSDFGDYIQRYGLYTDSGFRLPYYGATSYGHSPEDGDIEHTCDVMGAISRGLWAKRTLGRNLANVTQVQTEVTNLLASCRENLENSSINPLRKYSWWFGTNSDFSWFLSHLP